MTITPFAPRTPYMVMSVASFSTRIDWTSYGLSPESPPSVLGVNGTPSTMYSGAVLPPCEALPPRMRIVSSPLDVCPMTTPGEQAISCCSIGTFGDCRTSSAVALWVDPACLAGAGVSADFWPEAQPAISATSNRCPPRGERDTNDAKVRSDVSDMGGSS